MENGDARNGPSHDKESVKVAVNIRPPISSEIAQGCTDCSTIVPGEPQVKIGTLAFTFDCVFGNGAIPCSQIFEECVVPLVDAVFKGYNGTVLAYGQTGSGKTYTMGTNYNGEEDTGGIIPKVMEIIFSQVESVKGSTEFLIKVSFIEIFKEEVFDLLEMNPATVSKGEGAPVTKPMGPGRVPIQIRETAHGGITLAGVTEAEVRSKEEMALYLSRGSVARATGSTNMNSQSSRSHAIFTISMVQKKISKCSVGLKDDSGDDILSAKLHLVDLAGSERAKRTGADGMRLKEGIHINKGLLALGNVISALGDEKKRKEGGHIPYRDSKLTRLLQDSLGGNSKTVMIACVSPADTNAEETLNTLKYANRARNIQNKAVINRDPVAVQMQRMRTQIEQLEAELSYYRGDSSVPIEELQILKHKISLLEASNTELRRELQEHRLSCEHLSKCALEAPVEKDKLVVKLEAARDGRSWDEIESDGNQGVNLVKTYVSKIQKLEGDLVRLQHLNSLKHDGFPDTFGSDEEDDEIDDKELEHSTLQEKLDKELKELDKKLELKEAEMKQFTVGDTSVLKQHYEKRVMELEHEKKVLHKEIEELNHKLGNISSTADESTQKLKEEYLQKMNALEAQISELKKKQEAQTQLLKQKQKSDEAAKRLQEEIQRIKSQKVQLQNKIKQESEQFRLWKASREKEVLQLKKEGRRNEYEMHKLLTLNQRQKMVLQRKAEEAAMATKRLKELLEARKVPSRDTSGNSIGPGLQALVHGIEHDLEVIARVHDVRSQYERQMEEKTKMAQEVAKLKQEAEMLKQNDSSISPETMSPGARNSRIFALENMLTTSSSTLVSMASQLSEAEERERVFSVRGRWSPVRSLAEAKNLMNYLFNLASSSRCMARDKEIECREKDAEIKELKENVLKLSSYAKQLEKKNKELVHQIQQPQKNAVNNFHPTSEDNNEARLFDLRQGLRSIGLKSGGNSLELLEDMDTSESEHAESDDDSGDDEWVHPMFIVDKRNRKGSRSKTSTPRSRIKDNEGSKRQDIVDKIGSTQEKSDPVVCCSFSEQSSSCKMTTCECRASLVICSEYCGCSSRDCSNREVPPPEDADDDLVQQGASLLHDILAKTPVEQPEENGESRRKPLADIGNIHAKSKPNQPKKWRKALIQFVPATLHSRQSENIELPNQSHNNARDTNIASNTNFLRDRNSELAEETSVNKEPCDRDQRRCARNAKSEEKENLGL